jgi:hypothetical protein
MAGFKELLAKADLLNQNVSLSGTNDFLLELCRELDRSFSDKKETVPVKKKRGRKKKSV